MSGAWRAAAGAVAGAALAGLVTGVVYGAGGGWLTFAILATLGVATTTAVHGVVGRRAPTRTLRRQALVVGAVATGQAVGVVGLFVALMFVSAHDALLTVLAVAYAALLGAWAVARSGAVALDDLAAVRATLRAVGTGERDVRTGVEGAGEIAGLAREVDAMIARLDGEERARRSLFAAVSHDLRTPITALRLLADAISDGVVDDETARRYAERIGVHVQALGSLIDDLFELSRLESGELRWSMQEVALGDLVRESVAAMRPQAEAAAVDVRAVLESPDPLAQGDPDRLMRVLRNLIQNAIRHTPPDGTVTVRAARRPEGPEIEVADTGTGIPLAERERVFTPFHRLDPARSHDGAGLGLAISRAIVEAHGGRIWIADAARGTTVRLRLGDPARTPSRG